MKNLIIILLLGLNSLEAKSQALWRSDTLPIPFPSSTLVYVAVPTTGPAYSTTVGAINAHNIQLIGHCTQALDGQGLNVDTCTTGCDRAVYLFGGTNYLITNIAYVNSSVTCNNSMICSFNTQPLGGGFYIEYENEYVAYLQSPGQFLDWNVQNSIIETYQVQSYAWAGNIPITGHVVQSPVYFSLQSGTGCGGYVDVYIYGYILN